MQKETVKAVKTILSHGENQSSKYNLPYNYVIERQEVMFIYI